MVTISLGLVILLITTLGYLSNILNWRYINYGAIRFLYYIGALVHETSHAVLCILTGAKILEFTVFSEQPRVVHEKSKIPFLGELLISAAPIAGGLLFLFLVNRYLLGNYFALPQASDWQSWGSALRAPLGFLLQINLLQWQSWVMVLLLFNAGAMLGPSTQDLKNVWPALIILFFVNYPPVAAIGLAALGLIVANIILQILVIVSMALLRRSRTAGIVFCAAAALVVVFMLFWHANYTVKAAPIPTGLDPNFITQVDECFLPTAAVYGYDLRITSGFRSIAQQQQIYDQGRLEDGTIVSEAPPGHSLHNYGFAVDIVDRINGYNLDWPQLIAIGAYCGLGNGGVGDYPHFEYRGGLDTDQFAAGLRPTPLTLPCPAMATRAAAGQALTLQDLRACGAPNFPK
jgi:hypothetical protein